MDIFSHALWSIAGYKTVSNKKYVKFKPLWIAFWGIFPDIFAFAIPMILLTIQRIFTNNTWQNITKEHFHNPESLPNNVQGVLGMSHSLYNISHSIFIFIIIFLFVWQLKKWIAKKKNILSFKKPWWEMGAWLLHILIDIPTHSFEFYPTPFLWPFSDFKVDGFSWGQSWFMISNVCLLIIAYFILYRKKLKKAPKKIN